MADKSEQFEISEHGTSCHCVNFFINAVYVITVMQTFICAYRHKQIDICPIWACNLRMKGCKNYIGRMFLDKCNWQCHFRTEG